MPTIHSLEQLLKATALVSAAIAVAILLWYLIRRPPLTRSTKVLLLFGLGVMPIAVALTGNVAGDQFLVRCHGHRSSGTGKSRDT